MEDKIYNRLVFLKNQIEYHNKLYHGHDDPIISDQEFDKLCVEYDRLISTNPNIGFSKRNDVGFDPLEKFTKIKHAKPMLSLSNGFSYDDIEDFLKKTHKFLNKKNNDIEFICEPKIDGLSISLLYIEGKLIQALTRGNGVEGELVTENVLAIKNLPKEIFDCPKMIEIRGEIFITKNDFNKLNKVQTENNNKKFSNARNAAAGSIRQKNVDEISNRKLNFFAYTIGQISEKNNINSQYMLLKKFKKWGFQIPDDIELSTTLNGIKKYYDTMLNKRDSINYEIDGLVYKVNSFELQKRLGEMSRAPRWAIAHKLPSSTKHTIIRKIDLQVGRTGVITPVARVDTVNIGGVDVSNVTLHNEDEIKRKDIRIGDTVVIERAGDVIPHVLSVVKEKRMKESSKFVIKRNCPSCNKLTIKKAGEALRRCINVTCNAQVIEKIIHFCSKNALNIDGLAEKQIKYFFKKGLISKFSDIFDLYKKKDVIVKCDGFAELSVNKLLKSIDKSKSVSFDKFIISLGIKQVGENTAKILAGHYQNLPNLILNMKLANNKNSDEFNNLVNIDQIGFSVAEDIIKYFNSSENLTELKILSINLNIQIYTKTTIDSFFSNKKVVITGTLTSFSRDEIKTKLNSLGAKFISQISRNADILICGENPGNKLEKAEQLSIKIINEQKLNEYLKDL